MSNPSNNYRIQLETENRFSLKILAQKLRNFSPRLLHPILVESRYFFFKTKCDNRQQQIIKYSDGSWVSRKTTNDLMEIEKFLQTEANSYKILQVGIGNSSLFSTLRFKNEIIGLTIIQDEIDNAKRRFPLEFGSKYQVFFQNKYTNLEAKIPGGFDLIIDNDLSSYACCKHHFNIMMKSYVNLLEKDGSILVGLQGLGYFDSGFGLTHRRLVEITHPLRLKVVVGKKFYRLIKI